LSSEGRTDKTSSYSVSVNRNGESLMNKLMRQVWWYLQHPEFLTWDDFIPLNFRLLRGHCGPQQVSLLQQTTVEI